MWMLPTFFDLSHTHTQTHNVFHFWKQTTTTTKTGGPVTSRIYYYMLSHQYPVMDQGQYLEHLLAHLSYNRRRDLPWHHVLHRMAIVLNYDPKDPSVVMKVLEILYPYTDLAATHSILESLQYLLQREHKRYEEEEEEQQQSNSTATTTTTTATKERSFQSVYQVDMATLELITAAAAKAGSHETVMLIWDLIDLLQLQPTIAIYENTILAFAERGMTCFEHVFAVLGELEAKDDVQYHPSRALIRGVSTRFRRSHFVAKSAFEYQRGIETGEKIVVGVNQFGIDAETPIPGFKIDDSIRQDQSRKLATLRQNRNADAVTAALAAIGQALRDGSNLMPLVITAVEQHCTLGEISDVLRAEYGEYQE
ncbi:MAG: hypothetical protein EAY75_11710 [Bacteroidetes bacterium]|nr:MAG: hypothetical protein EAY75_11710 [Bacteroidota bacterium]